MTFELGGNSDWAGVLFGLGCVILSVVIFLAACNINRPDK